MNIDQQPQTTAAATNARSGPDRVTLAGIPLRLEMTWPFHKSTSGADFHVLHGTAWLADGGDLHAEFAANMSQTMVEALPSLSAEDAGDVVINAVRMAADAGQLEFLKSGKRQPVTISSRHFSFKTGELRFERVSPAQLPGFLKRKIYWMACRFPQAENKVRLADATDRQYLSVSAETLRAAAVELLLQGWLRLEGGGEWATPTPQLAEQAERFVSDMRQALRRASASFNEKLVG
jgi:hypothetical protein